ncbi:MAG: glycosyltransferase family 4 protein [Candidatus Bathyarchaeota archaeon]|jgi:glycosyltransferase involved in cell wall biosynthesis|nr:glycosyltransferase family 4 protein [Candidatus Bathyarchaeota archaeon A05DMB-5]MDH7557152.1 glycosyltransferase family 4 protein [Candidatus Bathyarchaeota archaeon]
MKVVMINDCAFVGETLLKYMPSDIEKHHIKRSRGLWSKTFSLAYKILKAKGDVYHVHYLLQDCYIAARLEKKPLIGHAHGSDLRNSLKHPLWGRIVRHNLKKCDKVLVSTPDVLGIARQFREDAEYLPNPVDTEIFYPKPLAEHDGKKRVLIASDSNWKVKGTDVAIRALGKIKDGVEVNIIRYGVDFERTLSLAYSLGLHVNMLPKIPHEKLNQYYWDADVVIDRFKLGSLGVVSLEAIACGRPVIAHVSSAYPEYNSFPLKDVTTENEIVKAIENADNDLWKKEYDYFKTRHTINVILERLLKIYYSVRGC